MKIGIGPQARIVGSHSSRLRTVWFAIIGALALVVMPLGSPANAAEAEEQGVETASYGSISGTVTVAKDPRHPQGQYTSPRNVDVYAWTPDYKLAGWTEPSSDGSYTVSLNAAGPYKLEFAYRGWNTGSIARQWWNGANTFSSATSIDKGKTGVNVTMGLGASISGTVKVPSDIDPKYTTVTVYDLDQHPVGSTWPTADGSYSVKNLAAGSYKVHFAFSGGEQWWKGKSSFTSASPVKVEAAAATTDISPTLLRNLLSETPKISGTAKVGKKLTAKPGTWTAGTAFKYQWYAGKTAIKGATKSTFTVTKSQKGKTIKVKVTGSKSGYTTVSKTSASTASVVAGTLKTATPKISGTAKVGKKLTAKPGTWTAGTAFKYQWYAGKTAIKGATKSTFTVTKSQKGKTIKVKVTGSKSGYKTASKTSKVTKKVT